MRTRLLLTGTINGACQSYQLGPIAPLSLSSTTQSIPIAGNKLAPNVIIVQDHSGSMVESPECDDTSATCPNCCGGGPTCQTTCKWNDVIDALTGPNGFLAQAAGKASFGLLTFPSDSACGVPAALDVPIGPDTTAQISATLQGLGAPAGGTPTAAALATAGAAPNFVQPGHDAYVILITDGEPNCNPSNSCPCTMTSPGACQSLLCLDDAAAVGAITTLRENGIKTIVIGFGASAGAGSTVLTAMANAGGMAGRCGGTTAYCQANNASGLQAILDTLRGFFQPCSWSISGTFDPATLVVQVVPTSDPTTTTTLLNGTDYSYSPSPGGGTVTVQGVWCSTLQNSNGQYTIQFSYAQGI